LNNDTKAGPDVLTRLVRKMQSDPGIGICGCRISSYDGSKHFHTGLGMDIYGYPIVSEKVFYVEGSCLLIKKELFHKLGGFDEKYLFFHEDIDLAWRVWLSGFKVEADPEALVRHFYGGTAGGRGLKKGYSTTYFRRYLAERNNIRTLLKNYGLARLFLVLPVYFIFNLAEIALLLLTFNWRAALCYLKAYGWNMIQLPDTLAKRKIIQKSRIVPDSEIIKQMYKGSGKFFIFKKTGVPKFS
jgi:GT2 family glycosyltransferase